MAFQTTTVNIVSDNPLYPNNKVEIVVDNDLRPEVTVVVPNTTFSFIVEFENCEEAVGKRYISEKFYNDLTNEITGKYKTDKGRIFSTLQKDATIYPYITINYSDIVEKVREEKEKEKKIGGKSFKELNYYGADIQNFENYNPIKLLQWLDISLQNSDGKPRTEFPNLLKYFFIDDGKINIDLLDRKIQDFFATEYIVNVDYTTSSNKNLIAPPEYVNSDDLNSKSTILNNIKNKSKNKSIANILDKMLITKGSILAGTSLSLAALSLKNKLSNAKPPALPKIPKIPIILPAIIIAKRKIKKTEQKPKKRKKILGKKKRTDSEKPVVNPKIDKLKSNAGGLVSSAALAKSAAILKQNSVTPSIVVFYTISSLVNNDTIILSVSNNFGKPTFTKQYSAVSFTQESAKADLKFELDNFGYYDSINGSYPKTGSPIPI